MKKTSEIMLPLVAGLAIALGIIIGRSTKPSQTAAPIVMQQPGNKLSEILNLIDASYVDTVDVEQMVEEAIPTVLDKLDPHTLYIPAEEMQQVNEEMEGNFGGIGVQFSIQEDTVVIVSVISGGPSSQLGILPGDRIIAVADTAFTGKKINNTNVMKSLRGEIGTTVRITVLRGNSRLDFNITRGLIPINSVDVAYMVDNSLGYIKIDRFAQTTYDEMLRAIAQLKNSGCTRLLVDLRGNSGGLLDIAIKMCNEFLHKGDLIVYTEGRMQPRADVRANGMGTCQDMDLTVLIDEYSASASEIFAGSMQDNDRATIVGRRSFGKGLVQQQIALSDNSSIRLTVARYHTASGRCIQRPYDKGHEDYYEDIYNRYEHGEFFNADSVRQNTDLQFKTRAGRPVYGGGGIMPDVFVPQDTTDMSDFYYKLRAKGIIYSFALDYADRNRKTLSEAGSVGQLKEMLDRRPIVDELIEFARKKNMAIDRHGFERSRRFIDIETKAYIANNILNNEGFYPIIHQMDNVFGRAVEIATADDASQN